MGFFATAIVGLIGSPGQLAQLDRALASGARGRGFESRIARLQV